MRKHLTYGDIIAKSWADTSNGNIFYCKDFNYEELSKFNASINNVFKRYAPNYQAGRINNKEYTDLILNLYATMREVEYDNNINTFKIEKAIIAWIKAFLDNVVYYNNNER